MSKTTLTGLIACEESQAVTKAFRELGHNFYSCDILPCSGGHDEWHIQDKIQHVLSTGFHMYEFLGCHPPCTYLANSGVCWLYNKDGSKNKQRWIDMEMAAIFFKSLLSCVKTIGYGYVENPIMHKFAIEIIGEKPTQIIQPYQFGHTESKATCLWIYGLPKLNETNNVKRTWQELPKNEAQKMHYLPPSKDRAKLRSKTYPGIAKAMAIQWSEYIIEQKLKIGG